KSRTSFVIGIIFLAVTLAALSRSGAAWGVEQTTHVQEHTLSMGEQIVGTWRLDSIYEEDAGGEQIDQFGVAPTGLFMADRHGNFSFQIVSIDGRRYAAKALSPVGMGAPGIIEAMTSFGTYAVNDRNHKLTLHVEYCLFRSCDHTDRTAKLKILGDTMEFISTVEHLTAAQFGSEGAANDKPVAGGETPTQCPNYHFPGLRHRTYGPLGAASRWNGVLAPPHSTNAERACDSRSAASARNCPGEQTL